jgi:asparagine synthase (glutamine-hydrolysing)
LKESFRPLVDDLLAPARIAADGLFEPAMIERLKRDHFENRANNSHLLWTLMVFHDWRRRWAV